MPWMGKIEVRIRTFTSCLLEEVRIRNFTLCVTHIFIYSYAENSRTVASATLKAFYYLSCIDFAADLLNYIHITRLLYYSNSFKIEI